MKRGILSVLPACGTMPGPVRRGGLGPDSGLWDTLWLWRAGIIRGPPASRRRFAPPHYDRKGSIE